LCIWGGREDSIREYLLSEGLTPFISAAAAVDGYLHTTPDCSLRSGPGWFGSYLRCNNMLPRTCCGIDTIDSPYQSLAIRSIMDGYSVRAYGYIGGNCTTLRGFGGNNWNSQLCIPYSGFNFTGLNLNNGNRKRVSGKVGCQRPDALVLPDGTEYDLSGLGDDEFKNIVDISVKSSPSADIPEKFAKLIAK
jgi:hypothetical protein